MRGTKKYKINEIFYSIQGEGANSGRPALFIRFSGCNLACPFCDTDFKDYKLMSLDDILQALLSLSNSCRFVVLTGGEPTLQVDDALVRMLHQYAYYIAIETNGTRAVNSEIDWVTLSPKQNFVGDKGINIVKKCDEVKVVFDGKTPIRQYGVVAKYYYVQPCDTGDEKRNKEIINQCIQFVKENPIWKISLQTHKMLNVR